MNSKKQGYQITESSLELFLSEHPKCNKPDTTDSDCKSNNYYVHELIVCIDNMVRICKKLEIESSEYEIMLDALKTIYTFKTIY